MRAILCLLMLAVTTVEVGEAQRRGRDRDGDSFWRFGGAVELGVRGGYDFNAEVASAGSQLRIPIIRQLVLVPSGDVFFAEGDADADWQANADLLLRMDELGGVYLGGGAAFVDEDFDADEEEEVEVGFNLLVGMEGGGLLSSRLRPFAEARWTFVEDFEPFRLVFGMNVPVD